MLKEVLLAPKMDDIVIHLSSLMFVSPFALTQGISALHWAASQGNVDVIKVLFDFGVFANPMEVDGER